MAIEWLMTEPNYTALLHGFELRVEKRKRCRPHTWGPWEVEVYDQFKPFCCVCYGPTLPDVLADAFQLLYKHVTIH